MRLTAKQTIDGRTETLFMETTATMTGTPQQYELRYRDESGDLRGTENILRVEKDASVTLLRGGEFASHLIIEPGVRRVSQYHTPYGTIMIGIFGHALQSDVDETGGTLSFRYCTDVELSPIGEFEFNIILTARPKNGARRGNQRRDPHESDS